MPRRALGLVALVLALVVPGQAVGATEVRPFGGAPALGAAPTGADRVLGLVATPTGGGYWQYTASGAVLPFGDAGSFGQITRRLNRPVVGMAATPSGRGYWLVAGDGGIFSFGDARFAGSTGAMRLNRPIVGMASTPTGLGYWLVAGDGGIFSFGDARFAGSTGAMRLNQPIIGMASSVSGLGYWLVARDGGVFSFGDARFMGSAGGERLPEPAVGIARTATGGGYRIATYDGRVYSYGDAADAGSMATVCKGEPVVGIADRSTGGYWLGTSSFLPTAIPAGADPIDTVAAESANLTTLLRVRQGCQPTPAPRGGRFSSPLPGSVVTSDYGNRIHPIYDKPQFHAGIDLAGAGRQILAPADGVVVQVRSRQGYGTTTVVDHGDGVGTVYGHQSAVAVRVGQAVKKGQAIGTIGHTGFATADHLHFEVRVHGVPTDPKRWL